MSEMIERVAKAIFADRYPGEDWKDYQKRDYCGHARAAIEAMRTPTDGQRNAYYELSHKTETMFDAHWERAIDAVLSEKP